MSATGDTGDTARSGASGLSDARRALLRQRLRGTATAVPGPAIPRLDDDAPAPASSAQVRLHILNELFPGSAAYHMHTVLKLQGALDSAALAKAFAAVVDRHESLRTCFRADNGQLLQVPVASAVAPFDEVDLSDDPVEARFERKAVDAIREPFDLASGMPCRAALFRLGDQDHRLVLTVHHIVTDEWSVGIILRDLAAYYREYTGGAAADLPTLPVRYRDFAAWQAARIDEIADTQLDYWRGVLDGAEPQLKLPLDHVRPARMSLKGALRKRPLPAGTSDAVERLAREAGATTYMTLLAAFQVLLHRYSGQRDISVGAPLANRNPSESEALVGLFLNSVVMRARPDPDQSFRAFLDEVRTAAVGAYANQELPLERLVADLKPDRDLGHNPLFQTMFVTETDALDDVRFDGLDARMMLLDTGTAKFDLTLFVGTEAGAMRAAIEYDTALFEAATIDRLLESFDVLLAGVVAKPDTPLGDLPILPSEDARRLDEWSTGDPVAVAGYGDLALVPDQFAARRREAPDAPAVSIGGTDVSYGELGTMADAVARSLLTQGVRRGDLVGLHLERSVEQIAAILGVLQAGAAYVPLDPAYPAAHRERIVRAMAGAAKDAGSDRSPAVITDADDAAFGDAVRTFAVAELIDAEPDAAEPPTVDLTADDLAYVLFTSGSTGEPKGVRVTHGNLHHSNAARSAYYEQPVGRYLLVSSFAFDSSVAGLFWTLADGGTLVLPPPGAERDPERLAELIEQSAVTHTLMLPALYDLVLDRAAPDQLATLRTVIVAGEACRPALLARHFAEQPQARLYNEYGPTECTVWATVHACASDDTDTVPIGRPIPNSRVFVLDERLRRVPVGVAGELCVAGDGVSPGYLGGGGDAWRFVTDVAVDGPHGGLTVERLYRTGDRVRYLGDGTLDFLGRLDGQLKIRGYRIEPAGIEAAIERHDAVDEAAVVAHTAAAGQRLVAYVQGGAAVSEEALRAHLREVLPDYMVPAVFVLLDELPRSPNGKVDRARLPEPAAATGADVDELAWADGTEAELALIWSRLLGVDLVAPEGDFFDLGGHSLLGVALMVEVERRFGVDLPLGTLFEAPRLKDFADRVRGAGGEIEERFLIPIQPNGSRPPLFCIHGGARLLARHLGTGQPVYLAFQQLSEVEPEANSVERMAGQYIDEMRAIQPQGPYHLVGFSFGGQIAFEIARRLRADGQEVRMLALCDPPPLIDQSYVELRVKRKLAAMQKAGGAFGKLGYLLREGPAVAGRAAVRLWWRFVSAYYAKTDTWSWLRPRTGVAVIAAGVALWMLGGVLMNRPNWLPVVEPLPMRAGTHIETTFVAEESANYDVELRFERALSRAELSRTALMVRERSPMDVGWQIRDNAGNVVANGDASDYLYMDYGARSLPGILRRMALRVPFGQTRDYFLSFGLTGSRTVSRGIGTFPARAGETYTVSGAVAADLAELDPTNPSLVVRLNRRAFDDHYAEVVRVSYGGMLIVGVGLLLLAWSWLRGRQTLPEGVVRFREHTHYVRVGNRYKYEPYDGEAVLFLPEFYSRAYESTVEAWSRVLTGKLSVHVIKGAERHMDLITEPGGDEVALRLAESLGIDAGASARSPSP